MATAKKTPAKELTRKPATKTTARKPATKALAYPIRPRDTEMMEEYGQVEDSQVPRSNLTMYSDKPVLDNQDLFVPKLRLAQGLTAEVQAGEAKPGQWLVLGATPAEAVTIVPLGMAKRRELRDPDTRSVACRSGDAAVGIGNPGGNCIDCPLGHWTPASAKRGQSSGRNLPPQCTFIYSYMVYVIDSGKMAILELAKTGELAGRMLNTMLVQGGFGTFGVKLTSTAKQGPKGTFYAPAVAASAVKADYIKKALAEYTAVR